MSNQVVFLSKDKDFPALFQGGVSLHGHTKHSRESLRFIGSFLRRHPMLRSWMVKQEVRCQQIHGFDLDFDRAYWTPPVTGELAYELEQRQILALGMRPMVSLSDHDNIEASTLLRARPGMEDVPISVEWTIRFGEAIFHLGIHNLPGKLAQAVMMSLQKCTEVPDDRRATSLLAELHALPSVLIVFNHPLWNLNRIARDIFEFEVNRFLKSAGRTLHAVELNGMRSLAENQRVIKLAASWNQVLISGGDRHGREPNANLNLTHALDFPEFVDEIRTRRQSTVLMLPQYEEPLHLRFYRGFTDVIRNYPGNPEGEREWDERIYHPDMAGHSVSLKKLWPNDSPRFLQRIFALALLMEHGMIHRTLRALMLKGDLQFTSPAENADGYGLQPARPANGTMYAEETVTAHDA